MSDISTTLPDAASVSSTAADAMSAVGGMVDRAVDLVEPAAAAAAIETIVESVGDVTEAAGAFAAEASRSAARHARPVVASTITIVRRRPWLAVAAAIGVAGLVVLIVRRRADEGSSADVRPLEAAA